MYDPFTSTLCPADDRTVSWKRAAPPSNAGQGSTLHPSMTVTTLEAPFAVDDRPTSNGVDFSSPVQLGRSSSFVDRWLVSRQLWWADTGSSETSLYGGTCFRLRAAAYCASSSASAHA